MKVISVLFNFSLAIGAVLSAVIPGESQVQTLAVRAGTVFQPQSSCVCSLLFYVYLIQY
jgi:hypothetical protein